MLSSFFLRSLYCQEVSPCIPGQLFNSCQLFNTWKNSVGQPILVTSNNKYDTPLGTRICARKFNVSYLRNHDTQNHPSGTMLFSSEALFARQLDEFLTKIEKNSYFLVYFGKIHLIILHQIYKYLTKIFTSFNMSHVDTLSEYLANESTQSLNKKTLIINHLLSLIEAQSNQAITTRFPGLPQHLATSTGFMMMKHDYGADLDLLIDKQEDFLFTTSPPKEIIKKMRDDYLDIFGSYLLFFNSYTSSLNKPDPFYGTVFMQHALTIQKKLSLSDAVLDKSSKDQRVMLLRALKTINPPLFFYNDESLRAIKMVESLAKKLPEHAEKVLWPHKVVEDAKNPQPIRDKNGIAITNQPAAYFLDANGERTTNFAQAKQLFVNIPTLQHMYSQELLPQPTWLNSPAGVILMLRACLGDFTVLLDPVFDDFEILDPCMRCIVTNSAIKAHIITASASTDKTCQECERYLALLRDEIKKESADSDTSLPDIGTPP